MSAKATICFMAIFASVAAAFAAGGRPLREAVSENRQFVLRIEPGREGDAPTRPTRAALHDRRDESRGRAPVWEGELVNEVAPAIALIRDDGRYVVTLDDYRRGGAMHAVVIYDERGRLLREFDLSEVLSARDEFFVRHDRRGVEWLRGARFAFPRGTEELVIALKWGKRIRIELSRQLASIEEGGDANERGEVLSGRSVEFAGDSAETVAQMGWLPIPDADEVAAASDADDEALADAQRIAELALTFGVFDASPDGQEDIGIAAAEGRQMDAGLVANPTGPPAPVALANAASDGVGGAGARPAMPVAAEANSSIENDPIVRMYRERVESLDAELDPLAGTPAGAVSYLADMRQRRAEFEQMLQSRRQQLRSEQARADGVIDQPHETSERRSEPGEDVASPVPTWGKTTLMFEDGQRIQHHSEFRENETLAWNGRFVNDQPEGQFQWWYGSGILRADGSYVAGKRQGPWTWRNPDGQISETMEFNAGQLAGTHTRWRENGQPEMMGDYADGMPHGRWTWWNDQGFIEREGDFENGQRRGLWRFYNADGSIERETEYGDGVESTKFFNSRGVRSAEPRITHWDADGWKIAESGR